MKKVTVNKLEPGMVTAEQILTKNGQMIVDKGVTLTRPLIMRLSFYCVLEVCIEDPDEPKDPETPHFIPAYSQKVKASKEFQTFQFDHSFVLNSLKSSMEGYVFTISRLTLMIFSNRQSNCSIPARHHWNFLICCIICAPTTTALTHIL